MMDVDRCWFGQQVRAVATELFSNLERFDHIDFPRGAPTPMPTFLRPSSSDICFSLDMDGGDDVANSGVSRRAACATGTGLATIGVNPEEFKVHAMLPEMKAMGLTLMQFLRVHSQGMNLEREFNSCSVKIHVGNGLLPAAMTGGRRAQRGTKVGEHRDNIWNPNGSWNHKANSTVENTPTVIVSGLADHCLIMSLKNTNPDVVCPKEHNLCFNLSHGSAFLLHSMDEKNMSRAVAGQTFGNTHWMHRVPPMAAGQIGVSLNFRVVKKTITVNSTTGLSIPVDYSSQSEERMVQVRKARAAWSASAHRLSVYQRLQLAAGKCTHNNGN